MLNRKVFLLVGCIGFYAVSCTLEDPLECTQGRTQCIIAEGQAQVQTCSAENKWDAGTVCNSGRCKADGSACEPVCIPNEIKCEVEIEDGIEVAYKKVCKSDNWDKEKCPSGLCNDTGTACRPVCVPNEVKCVIETDENGKEVAFQKICKSDNWEKTICQSGFCDDANRYCRPICYTGEMKCVQEEGTARFFHCKNEAWEITDCLSGKCLQDGSDCESVCEVSSLPVRKCVIEQAPDKSSANEEQVANERAIEYSSTLNKQASSSKSPNNRYDWVEVRECLLGCTECPEGDCEGTTCAVECKNGDTRCGERKICGNNNECKTATASQICQDNHWNVYEICSNGCDEGDRADRCKLDCENEEVKCEDSDRGIGVMHTCVNNKWNVSPCTGGAPCKDNKSCGDPNTCTPITRCEMPNGMEWNEYLTTIKSANEKGSIETSAPNPPNVFTKKICNNNSWSLSVCSDKDCQQCNVACSEEGKKICQKDFQINTHIPNISPVSQQQFVINNDLYEQVISLNYNTIIGEAIMICKDGQWISEMCIGTCKNGICDENDTKK